MVNTKTLEVLSIQSLCVAFIFWYGRFRHRNPQYKDILQYKLHIWDLDCWSVTHFTFHFILGYFYPNRIFLCMSGGVIWETFEFYCGKFRPKFLEGYGHREETNQTDKTVNNLWWYGKLSDIVMNGLGFSFGKYLSL